MSESHTPRFIHLRLHTEYSISDGIVQVDSAIARAAADGMPALGISDLANLFGMVKFYKGARGKGIKPIIGADCWITNSIERDKPFRAPGLRWCTVSGQGRRDHRQRLAR